MIKKEENKKQDLKHKVPVKQKEEINDSNKSLSKILAPLDNKTKTQYYILLLITFGFFYFYLTSIIEENKENIIDKTNKLPFKLEDLLKFLGNKENVLSVSNTINSIKLELKDKTLVQKDEIKKIGGTGILSSENKISIIFGNYSEELKNLIELEIK